MFTVFDEDTNEYSKVEEPDPSFIYTYADYLKWNFEERLELFRGKIFRLAAPNTSHQVISMNLSIKIGTRLKKQKCNVFAAPFDVRLPVKNRKRDNEITTVVQPDICVVCDESKLDDRGCCGAPDLVIEILSPGNSEKELKLKFAIYEEAGVKEYWIVNPAEESLAIFHLNNEGKYQAEKGYMSNNKVESKAVPGLVIKTKEIFTK